MTPFEKAVEVASNHTTSCPNIIDFESSDYLRYQLNQHIYYLNLYSFGIKTKGISVSNIKSYYGLKSKLIVDCVKELTTIKDNYAATLKNNKIDTNC